MATTTPATRLRGFARLSPERRKEIATAAGQASARSTNHRGFTTTTARAARRRQIRVPEEPR